MEVNAINSNTTGVNSYANVNEDNSNVNTAAASETENKVDQAAVYEPAKQLEKTTYKPDADKIKQMMAESDRQVAAFQRLIEGLFNKQAQKNGTAEGWYTGQNQGKGLKDIIGSLTVDDETRAQAQKDIEEGGYYSVDETAKRILDFAVALSGGDPSKISTLKDAVLKGFGAAQEAWGDELPEISKKTLEAVQNGFDEWEKAGSASAITLLNK